MSKESKKSFASLANVEPTLNQLLKFRKFCKDANSKCQKVFIDNYRNTCLCRNHPWSTPKVTKILLKPTNLRSQNVFIANGKTLSPKSTPKIEGLFWGGCHMCFRDETFLRWFLALIDAIISKHISTWKKKCLVFFVSVANFRLISQPRSYF